MANTVRDYGKIDNQKLCAMPIAYVIRISEWFLSKQSSEKQIQWARIRLNRILNMILDDCAITIVVKGVGWGMKGTADRLKKIYNDPEIANNSKFNEIVYRMIALIMGKSIIDEKNREKAGLTSVDFVHFKKVIDDAGSLYDAISF